MITKRAFIPWENAVWTLLFLLYSFSLSASTPASFPQHDRFIITSIPKCGTHLIMQCMSLLTGKPIVDAKVATKREFRQSLLDAETNNTIIKCYHYSNSFPPVLQGLGYKTIFMCRDPRDACVSLVFYLDTLQGKKRDFFVIPDDWDILSFEEKLYRLITGENCTSYMQRWYKRLTPWAKYSQSLLVRFEDLIGSEGGGDNVLQRKTIRRIANHLHIHLSNKELEHVAKHLYKANKKPRKEYGKPFIPGQIGNWKIFFSNRNKKIFKEKFSPLLIELGYEKNNQW